MFTDGKLARCLGVTLVLAGLSLASPVQAQQSPAELGKLGEAQIFADGTAQDIKAGIANLNAAAEAGDVNAKAVLGKILLDGYYLTANPSRGIQLLHEAAQAGHAGAALTLGNALLWGYNVERDTVRAKALLEQSAAAGDAEAMRVLGEQLVSGNIWPPDAARGSELLEKAMAGGNASAGITLGSILLHGTGLPPDRKRALILFEQAAASGNGQGLEMYGEWLMWKASDPAAAEAMLRRAASLGRGSAWTILAEGAMYGYLGPHSRAKFTAFADQARAAGQTRIEVLEANRQMWGISMRASGPRTIAGLESAARKGNADAARFLIGLVRDGNHLNIRKDTARALAYVDEFSKILTALESEQLGFSIKAKAARTVSGYRTLYGELLQRKDLLNDWFGRELVKASPNLVVYALQSRLKEEGRYSGPVTGMATAQTVAALKAECIRSMPQAACRRGVLDPAVAGALLLR